MLFGTFRYSRWDGTQEIFDIDANELMEQLSEELLRQGDVMRALREMFRNGVQNQEGRQMNGLRDLLGAVEEPAAGPATTAQHGLGG